MHKQIWDLCRSDIERYPIWFYPMEGDGIDEATVAPATPIEVNNLNNAVLVRAHFIFPSGKSHLGYLQWGLPHNVGVLRPTLFLGDKVITFWSGIIQPEPPPDELEFPIKVLSEEREQLASIALVLEGFYFINSEGRIQCVK